MRKSQKLKREAEAEKIAAEESEEVADEAEDEAQAEADAEKLSSLWKAPRKTQRSRRTRSPLSARRATCRSGYKATFGAGMLRANLRGGLRKVATEVMDVEEMTGTGTPRGPPPKVARTEGEATEAGGEAARVAEARARGVTAETRASGSARGGEGNAPAGQSDARSPEAKTTDRGQYEDAQQEGQVAAATAAAASTTYSSRRRRRHHQGPSQGRQRSPRPSHQ